jgi:flagellar biosynthetic protein FliO
MMTPAAAILLLILAEPAPGGDIATRPRVVNDVNSAIAPRNNAAAARPLAISAPHDRSPLRVTHPNQNSREGLAARSPLPSLATMLAALGLVLGLFLAAAWLLRRSMPAGPRLLPGEVVEVLGRVPLASRQHAHLVRCGNKLLLLAVAPGNVETLTEITDPLEVERLAGLCQQSHPQSASTAFRQVFQQFGQKPAKGFLEPRRSNDLQLANEGFDRRSADTEADRG